MPIRFKDCYKGKRVLVTGHTGFKGSWLSIWLRELGADVIGYALEPKSAKDNYVLSRLDEKINSIIGDVRDYQSIKKTFDRFRPEIVFHLAAQPLVKLSYKQPLETLSTNIIGTANVLEALRHSSSGIVALFITSDKCYENKERGRGYKETDVLGGYDPYSASKSAAELVISSFRNSYFKPENYVKHLKSVASARAGNVIGGGDWSEDRIIPDCIRFLEKSEPIKIRNPNAVRPWQHVLDSIGGYLLLGQKMLEEPTNFCEAWNFGPDKDSLINVEELTDKLIADYGTGSWIDISSRDTEHETRYLALDCSKAKRILDWQPLLRIDEAIKLTADWYKRSISINDCYSLACEQIEYYSDKWHQNFKSKAI